MHDVVVSAVAAAVMAATKTFNSTSQKLFLFIRLVFLFISADLWKKNIENPFIALNLFKIIVVVVDA